jgi:hypothetical protein
MIGRKSWLFAGAGTIARAMTVIETTKLNDLDPQAYLADILDRIHNHKINNNILHAVRHISLWKALKTTLTLLN